MNLRNIVKKSLLPQYAVSEIFVCSVLGIFTLFLAYTEIDDVFEAAYALVGLVVTLLLSTYILFFRKTKSHVFLLKLIQVLGTIVILIISTLYVSRLLLTLDLSDLNFLNYLFLLYAAIIMLRFIILVSLLFGSSKISLLKNALLKIIQEMPYAEYKQPKISLLFIVLALSSVYILFNKDRLIITLGESIFISLFILDILNFDHKENAN